MSEALAQGQPTQLLSFWMGGEEHAMELSYVKEVITHRAVTRVPSVPAFVLGVINLRGSIVPVVDLGAMLGLPRSAVTANSCFVIAPLFFGDEGAEAGLLVESVGQVLEVDEAEMTAAPAFGTRVSPDLLMGMARSGGRFIPVVNLMRALSAEGPLGPGAFAPKLAAPRSEPSRPGAL